MPTTSRWLSASCCSWPSSWTLFGPAAASAPGRASVSRSAANQPAAWRECSVGESDEAAHVTARSRSSGSAPFDTHRAVTMKDVAAAAGVAQSTVSRILNDAPSGISVSAETRRRVLAIASDLGYRPHPFARALRGAPSMLLCAVVRAITDPFFAAAVEVLSIEAKERGYSVVLGHARAKADEALALTAILETRHCDAIVLVGDFRGERRLVDDLRTAHVRVVGLWHGSERSGRPFPTVIVDSRAGIHAALK